MAHRIYSIGGVAISVGYYEIGVRCLHAAMIARSHFSFDEVEEIGCRCAMGRRMVFGRIGNKWVVAESVRHGGGFCAHYIVNGNRMTQLHPNPNVGMTVRSIVDKLNGYNYSKPLNAMNAREMFMAGVEKRPHRKHTQKCAPSERLKYSVRMEK